MPAQATLIYPHQLYANHPTRHPDALHILIEDPLFFGDERYPARFHQMKLAYHRATMKRYQAETLRHLPTEYIDHARAGSAGEAVFAMLAQRGMTQIHVIDPTDWALEKRIRRHAQRHNLTLHWHESPNFITTTAQIEAFWRDKRPHDYHQTTFYTWQRRRLGILLDEEGKPLGGQWTYDSQNRRKLPRHITPPPSPQPYTHPAITEAYAYVQRHWAHNVGTLNPMLYPTNHAEAQNALIDFLDHKLNDYGTYQDAITARHDTLFHSLLSAPLNIGLLDVHDIIRQTLTYAQANPQTRLESLEGFIRQLIGWREFMRAVYLREGVRQRTANFFGNDRALDEAWYTGQTGIPPLDDAIQKAHRTAYNHHIERLMLIGNVMLLAQVHPNAVYAWFMEMFIDAYDWVMVPNVYGMSQYADGGLITTKPYISASNYVRKMSDYKTGEWCATWDALYWRFIHHHRDFFGSNARLALMTSYLRRMDDNTLQAHITRADAFIQHLPRHEP